MRALLIWNFRAANLPPSIHRSARMRERQKCGFARDLRRRSTDAERALWHHLRNRTLTGCKFRRQHPIGPYIVDFACVERALIVELDGGQHVQSNADARRTDLLQSEGFRVLRFWNNDALMQIETVLAVIHDALAGSACPHSNPSPARGGAA
jgi:primosomal protein N' (replication factor Y)